MFCKSPLLWKIARIRHRLHISSDTLLVSFSRPVLHPIGCPNPPLMAQVGEVYIAERHPCDAMFYRSMVGNVSIAASRGGGIERHTIAFQVASNSLN